MGVRGMVVSVWTWARQAAGTAPVRAVGPGAPRGRRQQMKGRTGRERPGCRPRDEVLLRVLGLISSAGRAQRVGYGRPRAVRVAAVICAMHVHASNLPPPLISHPHGATQRGRTQTRHAGVGDGMLKLSTYRGADKICQNIKRKRQRCSATAEGLGCPHPPAPARSLLGLAPCFDGPRGSVGPSYGHAAARGPHHHPVAFPPCSTVPTFALCLELLVQQVVLPVAEDEGQEGEDEGIEDADDGQDVSPAHGAVAQGVLPCLLPAHVPDGLCIPAVGEDHAAQHQAESCEGVSKG